MSFAPAPAGCGIDVLQQHGEVRFRMRRRAGAIPIGLGTLILAGYIVFQTLRIYAPYLAGGAPTGSQHPLVTVVGVVIGLCLAFYGAQHVVGRMTLIVTSDELIRHESGPLGRSRSVERGQVESIWLDVPQGRRSTSRLDVAARTRDGVLFSLVDAMREDEARWLAGCIAKATGRMIEGPAAGG